VSVDLTPRVNPVERIPSDMKTWADANTLSGWSMYPNGGSITKDTTNQRTGLACAKITSPGGGTSLGFERYDMHLPPGQWCYVEGWAKASVSRANGYGFRLVNLTSSRELKTDGTWVAAVGNFAQFARPYPADTYLQLAMWFKTEDAAGVNDIYAPVVNMYGPAGWLVGESLWIDSISLKVPNARPVAQLGVLTVHGGLS
jgi:hypothetical protein